MLKTKKGEMTIATIVAIALAVVVLIFLVYGFSTGWGNLWDRVTTFGGIGDETSADDLKLRCDMLEAQGRKDGSEWTTARCGSLGCTETRAECTCGTDNSGIWKTADCGDDIIGSPVTEAGSTLYCCK